MAGADDIFAFGPRGSVLPAVTRFATEVSGRCGLNLQWSKTEFFCWQGDIPADSPQDLKLAGRMVDGVFRRGFLCWGVPVGEKEYVSSVLLEKVAEIVSDARSAMGSLHQHRQAAWAALKWSVWPRFEYWAQHCYPSDSVPAAEELDRRLWGVLEDTCGLQIPWQGSPTADSGECTISAPGRIRDEWSFAAWVARQPVKMGGDSVMS